MVSWLCLTSHRQHPHLLSLAKDETLGFYRVPTRNRTPSRCVAVHYTTAEQCQLHLAEYFSIVYDRDN